MWNDPFVKSDQARTQVSEFMSRAWASFVVDMNPNDHKVKGVPNWEPYSTSASGWNLVIGEDGFADEDDVFRRDAIDAIIHEILKI